MTIGALICRSSSLHVSEEVLVNFNMVLTTCKANFRSVLGCKRRLSECQHLFSAPLNYSIHPIEHSVGFARAGMTIEYQEDIDFVGVNYVDQRFEIVINVMVRLFFMKDSIEHEGSPGLGSSVESDHLMSFFGDLQPLQLLFLLPHIEISKACHEAHQDICSIAQPYQMTKVQGHAIESSRDNIKLCLQVVLFGCQSPIILDKAVMSQSEAPMLLNCQGQSLVLAVICLLKISKLLRLRIETRLKTLLVGEHLVHFLLLASTW